MSKPSQRIRITYLWNGRGTAVGVATVTFLTEAAAKTYLANYLHPDDPTKAKQAAQDSLDALAGSVRVTSGGVVFMDEHEIGSKFIVSVVVGGENAGGGEDVGEDGVSLDAPAAN
ncbi:hypothetical protein HDV00_004124 [Rhizophlyctis rosea]|nr:hypothetical protein HDV00_004124 [Rhizophlyctis rosea]